MKAENIYTNFCVHILSLHCDKYSYFLIVWYLSNEEFHTMPYMGKKEVSLEY